MTDRPAPLTAPGTDLRDCIFMPLSMGWIRNEGALLPTEQCFRAAILLMAHAWYEDPPASLPDDDRALAHWAGLGMGKRAVRAWQRARDLGAIAAWVKCSDGRLYHPELARHALAELDRRRVSRVRNQIDMNREKFMAELVARDGARCRTCSTTERLVIDHVLPVSRGGDNALGNLQILCLSCNSRKGAD